MDEKKSNLETRILLIDSSPFSELVLKNLKNLYLIDQVETEAEALTAMDENEYDAILLSSTLLEEEKQYGYVIKNKPVVKNECPDLRPVYWD